MSTELARQNPTKDELAMLERMGALLHKSGLCKGARSVEQAIALILMGREVGLPAMQALSTIHVIEGKPTASVHLIGALLARGGVTWQATKHDEAGCTVEFSRPGWKPATSSFAKVDAERAGLVSKDNWRKWPRAMYYARAFAEGARRIGPDLLCGLNYTPEELAPDIAIDNDGVPAAHGSTLTFIPDPSKPAAVESTIASLSSSTEKSQNRGAMKYSIARMNEMKWSNLTQRGFCSSICERPIASRADVLEPEWAKIARNLDEMSHDQPAPIDEKLRKDDSQLEHEAGQEG